MRANFMIICPQNEVMWFQSEQEMLDADFELESAYIEHEVYCRTKTSELFKPYKRKRTVISKH